LENALKKWGIWAEYTFDVEEDCEIDVSLAVAAHRTPYESGIQSNLYWWDDKSQGGYVVDGFDDDPYMKILGFKYTMALDDEIQRTAYESAPIFHNNGITFLNSIKDPRTWENTQDDVNGEKLNSCYLRVFPYPFWGDESNPDSYGTGWYSYYKSDMLDKAAEQGVIPTSVRDAYSHADYMNLPVSKGRHTIKVQNCGGLSWFDEIRIKAHSQSGGVDDISADDLNTTDGIAQYFDLQGRKILNPSNGIYIVKRGNKVTKEVIR
jgi:hypothetical protein